MDRQGKKAVCVWGGMRKVRRVRVYLESYISYTRWARSLEFLESVFNAQSDCKRGGNELTSATAYGT